MYVAHTRCHIFYSRLIVMYMYISFRFIRWPHTTAAKINVAADFYRLHKKRPLLFGCVDGTHVQIVAPRKDRETVFVNRKGFHSLNVMVRTHKHLTPTTI